MTSKIKQSILGGIIATAVMTVAMMLFAAIGMPDLDAASMLSQMLGIPIVVGWFLHFLIGITFALSYALIFIPFLKRFKSKILKGILFGIAIFIFAQIMIGIMGAMTNMPPPEDNMMFIVFTSLIGHIIFGIVVALFYKE